MRHLYLILVLLSTALVLEAQDAPTEKKTTFLALHIGVSQLFASEFSPNTRGDGRLPYYYPPQYANRTFNIQLSVGRQFKDRLYWLGEVGYSKREGTVECPCTYCDKAFIPPSDVRVHQIGVASGIRWLLVDNEKIDFGIDGLTGVKLDINQSASIPWFVAVSPVFNYSFHKQHALSLRAGFSSHIVGYQEYSFINTLGYQFSF